MSRWCTRTAIVLCIVGTVAVLIFNTHDAVDSGTVLTIDCCHHPPPPCARLFDNDSGSITHWSRAQRSHSVEHDYINYTCADYRRLSGLDSPTGGRVDNNITLAFAILAYKDAAHVINLVRMLFTAHDYYCIHVDAKSRTRIYAHLRTFADCFDNIVLASKREVVYWASHGILQANLNCIHDLLDVSNAWQYVISVSAQLGRAMCA
jgi:hypothetical protein